MGDPRRFMVANPLGIYAIYLDNYTFTFKDFALLAFFQRSMWMFYTKRSFKNYFCTGEIRTCSLYFIAMPQMQEECWPEANQESWISPSEFNTGLP